MPALRFRSPIPAPTESVFAWHARPGAFERLVPPWQDVTLERHDGIREGDRAVIRLAGGVKWVAEHRDVIPGVQFRDVQVSGPFASWSHTHRTIPAGPNASLLEDDVRYQLPLAPLSRWLAGDYAERQLERTFRYRHRVTQHDVGRHHRTALAPMTVAVTGSSGLIGRALCAFLTAGGHRVVRLLRDRSAVLHAPRGPLQDAAYWNPDEHHIDLSALARADAVVHLAGEPVLPPYWTEEKRERIYASRVQGTALLARTLAELPRPPRAFVTASAVGYYGNQGAEPLAEDAPPGEGFFPDVCRDWEAAAAPAAARGVRTVPLRIGAVLTPAGGALDALLPFFRLGLGAKGLKHFVPWVALDDVLYAVLHVLGSDLHGPVNLAAPEPTPQDAFAETLGSVLNKAVPFRVPAGLLRRGGLAVREAVLASARVVPDRLLRSGFDFAYPTLPAALAHVLGRPLPPDAAP